MIKAVHKYTTLIKFLSPCHNFSYQIFSHPFGQLTGTCSNRIVVKQVSKKQFCNFTVSNSPDSFLELALQVKNCSYD